MTKPWLLLAPLALVAFAAAGEASAAEEKIALGELNAAYGVSHDSLHNAAIAELHAIDSSRVKRTVVVSISVLKNDAGPVSVAISAAVRDKKTGNILAVLQGTAKSEKDGAAIRENVLRAAVHSALSQVPQATR